MRDSLIADRADLEYTKKIEQVICKKLSSVRWGIISHCM